MKLTKLLLGTALFLSVHAVQANPSVTSLSADYFDLISLHEDSSVASNFINSKIRDMGGIDRVREAQKAGDDEASMILGYIYLNGHVFEKNVDMAIDILSPASLNGPYSSFILGKHYLDLSGEYHYSDHIKREGAAMIEFAAMHEITEAEFLAGMLFISGDLLPEDRDLGMMHLKSAAYKGHSPSRKFLSNIDAIYYQEKMDFDKVQKMMTEGNLDASVELALMYKEGWKVRRDLNKAVRILKVASAKGSSRAEQILINLKK